MPRPGSILPAGDGLRERKKARTRREISDVATRLFGEHGFEDVTLSQIAEAAEVSVKTIFNHFGSKEDLYFDRAAELEASVIAAIVEREPGETVLGALRALLTENLMPFRGRGWHGLDEPAGYELFRQYVVTQDRSPSLRARRLTLGTELGERLRPVVAAELDREPDDPVLLALIATVVATMHLRDAELRVLIADRAPVAAVRRRVVTVMEAAFDRIEAAYADVDRPRGAAPASAA